MRKLNYSLFKGLFLSGITASFLFSSSLCAQTISGVAQICPGVPYTYDFDSPDYCDSRGIMTCEGCDQNSVSADNYSISLVWLPGQSSYVVSVPTRCKEPDAPQNAPPVDDVLTMGVVNVDLNTPSFICPSNNPTLYIATQRQVPNNDSGCSNPPSVFVSLSKDPNYPLFGTGYPFDISKGDNGTGMHV